MKKIIGLLSIIVLLAACNGSDTSSPKGTVTAFIEAMKKGDIEGVKKLVTKSDLSMLTMAETMAKSFGQDMNIDEKMKKDFAEKSKDVSFTVKDEKITGNDAEVNVEVKEKDKTETHPFKLLKEDGSWKISLISTGMAMSGSAERSHNDNMNADSLRGIMQKGMDELKNMNSDSLQQKLKEGLKNVNMDSLKREMQKGLEQLEKNPDASKQMKEALKKMKEAEDKMKQH
jgi:ketosteroid isomerase-like protein